MKKIQEQLELVDGYEIIRRYFVMNTFDGILTVIGVLIGAFISHSIDHVIIIKITIATGIAMFISGAFGTFATEQAEREKSLKDTEKALMSTLQNSNIKAANKTATFVLSLVDGLSPLLGSLLVISPFFFVHFITEDQAFYLAIILSLTALFGLGLFLGKISKQNLLVSGLKMLLIGMLAVGITSLLGFV